MAFNTSVERFTRKLYKHYKQQILDGMKGGIPSGPYWNEGLCIVRNLQQISGVILIESNEEEVTDGNKGVDLLSRIYTELKQAIKALALSLSLMAK